MQYILWITYLSGTFHLIGYFVVIPMGLYAYGYMQIMAISSFVEVTNNNASFFEWLRRPFRKGFITGPLIFICHIVLQLIPGLNWLTSFYFGWFAVLDYYDNQYLLLKGPYLNEDEVNY